MKILFILISIFSFSALGNDNFDYDYSMSDNENKILQEVLSLFNFDESIYFGSTNIKGIDYIGGYDLDSNFVLNVKLFSELYNDKFQHLKCKNSNSLLVKYIIYNPTIKVFETKLTTANKLNGLEWGAGIAIYSDAVKIKFDIDEKSFRDLFVLNYPYCGNYLDVPSINYFTNISYIGLPKYFQGKGSAGRIMQNNDYWVDFSLDNPIFYIELAKYKEMVGDVGWISSYMNYCLSDNIQNESEGIQDFCSLAKQ